MNPWARKKLLLEMVPEGRYRLEEKGWAFGSAPCDLNMHCLPFCSLSKTRIKNAVSTVQARCKAA